MAKIGKRILRSNFMESVIRHLACWYLKFVKLTTKWEVSGVDEMFETLKEHESFIAIGWHGRILGMPFFWKEGKVLNALVSPHHDGRLVINLLKEFNIGNISGSTNKNSTQAALKLMRELQQGHSIAIIPDGPRGPSMKMTMSPLFYAQKTGKPILCISYSIKGAKICRRSWDNMMIPLPFHKGIYIISKPFFIPQNATEKELEAYRKKIEKYMNDTIWEIDRKMDIPFVPQGKNSEKSKKKSNKNIEKGK